MNYLLDLLVCSCLISLFSNFAFYFYSKRANKNYSIKIEDLLKIHAEEIEKEKKKPQRTEDAKALLADLATGPALVKIEYVDRSEVLLRSPRHM